MSRVPSTILVTPKQFARARCSVVAEYQKRHLSYDDHAYDAFRAILSQMRTPSYWGLINLGHPDGIVKNRVRRPDWNKYTSEGIAFGFAHALSWYVADPFVSKRRASRELPSWS